MPRQFARVIREPIEAEIASMLNMAGVTFVHKSEDPEQKAEFVIPNLGVSIVALKDKGALKAYWTIAFVDDVIVVQGERAALTLRAIMAAGMSLAATTAAAAAKKEQD